MKRCRYDTRRQGGTRGRRSKVRAFRGIQTGSAMGTERPLRVDLGEALRTQRRLVGHLLDPRRPSVAAIKLPLERVGPGSAALSRIGAGTGVFGSCSPERPDLLVGDRPGTLLPPNEHERTSSEEGNRCDGGQHIRSFHEPVDLECQTGDQEQRAADDDPVRPHRDRPGTSEGVLGRSLRVAAWRWSADHRFVVKPCSFPDFNDFGSPPVPERVVAESTRSVEGVPKPSVLPIPALQEGGSPFPCASTHRARGMRRWVSLARRAHGVEAAGHDEGPGSEGSVQGVPFSSYSK